MDELAALPDQDVRLGLEQATFRFFFRQAIEAAALPGDLKLRSGNGARDQTADILLEERIHLEQEREAAACASGRRLEAIVQQKPSQAEQVSPALVRAIEDHPVPPKSRNRDVGD